MFSWTQKPAAAFAEFLIKFLGHWFAKILSSLWELRVRIEGSRPITLRRGRLTDLAELAFSVEAATHDAGPICLTMKLFYNGRAGNGPGDSRPDSCIGSVKALFQKRQSNYDRTIVETD